MAYGKFQWTCKNGHVGMTQERLKSDPPDSCTKCSETLSQSKVKFIPTKK
jgi:hypothetical protein